MFNEIKAWGDRHHPTMLDAVRIMLGLFILLKGYTFMINSSYLKWILLQQSWVTFSPFMLSAIMHYVIFIHMVGGLLIMLGVITRPACLLQLPVIIGALFLSRFFISPLNSGLWLTLITCFLLITFLIVGSGPLSLDKFLNDINTRDN